MVSKLQIFYTIHRKRNSAAMGNTNTQKERLIHF